MTITNLRGLSITIVSAIGNQESDREERLCFEMLLPSLEKRTLEKVFTSTSLPSTLLKLVLALSLTLKKS